MSIDLSQFHQVFFEESFEGLEAMESCLLELKPDNVDKEVINTIFRAAHSIKGGSATFGFNQISDFTHVLETLLDQVRDGSRDIDQEMIDLLLKSVDCLRDLLQGLQANEKNLDTSLSKELTAKFEEILDGGPPSTEGDVKSAAESSKAKIVGWDIAFKPEAHILQTGNEPLRMFRELQSFGKLEVYATTDRVPVLQELHADECYISWDIKLRFQDGEEEVAEAVIHEVFEWVADDCELTCTPVYDETVSELANPPVNSEVEDLGASGGQVQASVPTETNSTPKAREKPGVKSGESGSIRVGIDKIDNLINMVGELVITQSMLGQLGDDFDMADLHKLKEGLSQLEHNTRELQESVMRVRMIPISFTFSRFPRMVRDLCQKLEKKVELKLMGEQTELDKTVMEKIGDPLVHLVRNSLDHGIESPDQRVANGKPETGRVTLNAYHQGGNIIIDIADDGAGINKQRILEKAKKQGLINDNDNLNDEQIHDLIFHPGFSTAEVVSDVSGRGVGMDVVRRNIEELNGSITVHSEETKGSTFSICLPLTLAILDGQLARIGSQTYIFPLISIVESLQIDIEDVNSVGVGCDLLRLRNEYVPIIKMHEVFNIPADNTELDKSLLVVVEGDGEKVGLVVDELSAQQQVVIKSLEDNYKKVDGISGATILGDGTVSLILDITGIIKMAGVKGMGGHISDNENSEQAA